jgi:type IV pilus assembly protein PilQ
MSVKMSIHSIANFFSALLASGTICYLFALPPTGHQPARIVSSPVKDSIAQQAKTQRMTFDFKDTDIRDIVRTISIAYGLNIITDKDIAAKVTIHLTDVPVLDGLRTILSAHDLALIAEGDIYRITKVEDKGTAAIGLTRHDTLNIDIENLDIKDFIKDISAKTGLNIIAEKGVEGRITGSLRNITVEDGIRALFEANGFITRYRGDIMMVSGKSAQGADGAQTRYMPGVMGGMGGSGRSDAQLDVRVKEGKVSMNLNNADIGDALKQIAEQSKLNFITYGDVRGSINAKLDNVPIERAISLIIAGTNYAFSIRDSILLIGDRNSATPSGQALSTSSLIHLKHVKADNFMAILPKSIPASNILLVKEQNAILVTGTMDLMTQVQDFVTQVDIPTPQIMIEAVVVEFTKDNGADWGVEASTGGPPDTTGINWIPGLSVPFGGTYLNNAVMTKLNGWTHGTIGYLPDNFMLKIHALESQKKAKVMAQPRIATLNGNKASINVGTTSYFKLTGGTFDNPLVRFQTIQSGIKLDITPWISQSGQVTVEISPEISNSTGNNTEGYPDVSTRSVNTTIRLSDGETIILGGLIQASDNKTTSKVPLLGDIPLLGKLFQTETSQKGSSELVIYLTPHIFTQSDTVDLKQDLDRFKLRMKSNKELLDDYSGPTSSTQNHPKSK